MTELTVPPDADEERTADLVREHVSVGDTVEIWGRERTDADDPEHSGVVTGFETGYLELEGDSPEEKSVRYDEIDTVIRAQTDDETPDSGP
ncbi:hypothetical protein SAMN04487967_2186 [Natronorubrum sediminis]|uniref:Uncharacterized protein n=1 Tax=Natronorubrum sediminis TaxID=640943 RepID=A0A1H6FXX9_9EURY|nr:hypothetical protein [Natronorubrum sediminis]SEH15669.1 hypothetical protein SAMN04487967_2186 [Natronorubrum sediminis]